MNIKYISKPTRIFPAIRFYPIYLKLFPILYRVPETVPVFSSIITRSIRDFCSVINTCSYNSSTLQIIYLYVCDPIGLVGYGHEPETYFPAEQ